MAFVLVVIAAVVALVSGLGGGTNPGPPVAPVSSTGPAVVQSEPATISTAGLAYIGTGGGVWALEPDGTTSTWAGPTELSQFCDTPCMAALLEWSPDGRTLAVLTTPRPYAESGDGDVTVQLMSPGGGDLRELFACPDALCERSFGRSLAWSPDSRQVAVTVESDLYVADVDGGLPELVCTCKATPATYLRDGRLAIVDAQGLAAIDPTTRQSYSLAEIPGAVRVVWTPDRTRALVTTRRGGSVEVDVVSHITYPARRLHAAAGAWSTSGFPYAFTVQRTLRHSPRAGGAELWVTGPRGRPPKLLHRFPAAAGDVRSQVPVWSPDGSRIALFLSTSWPSGKVRIIDVRSGKVLDAFATEGGVAWRDAVTR